MSTDPNLDVVERRWVEINLIWRLMKINRRDPRYAASEPYDPSRGDGGMPTVSLAELRAQREQGDDAGDSSDAGDAAAANKSRSAANKARSTSSGPTSRRGANKAAAAEQGDAGEQGGAGDSSSETDPAAGDAGAAEQQ